MITAPEIARSVEGLARLARFDAAGRSSFGGDPATCRRSFLAYALVFPAMVLSLWLDVLRVGQPGNPLLWSAAAIGIVIEVAGFPVIMLAVLRLWHRPERWLRFVTAYNWYSAASVAVSMAFVGLAIGPLRGLGIWPFRVLTIYLWVVEAFLAESILEIGALRAGSIVVLDVGFSTLTQGVAGWIGSGVFEI